MAPSGGCGVEPLPRLAWRSVLLIAAGVAVLLLATAARYGYHRDELYFRVAGQHLAWGYVDQPPLVPLLARLATMVADTVVMLRLPAALATVVTVLITAAIARELGGAAAAQRLAAAGAAVSLWVLGSGHLLHTTTFDLTAWVALYWCALRALRTGQGRWWLAAGMVAGVGLYAKYLVVLAGFALLVSLALVGPRALLRNRWLWAGVGLAGLLAVPTLAWQATHDWPQLTMAGQISAVDGATHRVDFLPYQLVLIGPPLTPVWIAGLVGLLRRRQWQRYRAVGVAYLVAAAVTILAGGQEYYAAGLLVVLLAAGSVVTAGWAGRSARRHTLVGSALVLNLVLAVVVGLPVVPADRLGGSGVLAINDTVGDQVGWPSLVAQIDRVYEGLPAAQQDHAVVLTRNYGEAGAVARYGPARGLPTAYSGHNSYHTWGPPPADRDVVIAVGIPQTQLRTWFRRCELRTRVNNGLQVPNEEQGQPIITCHGLRTGWSQLWPQLRHIS